MWRIPVALLLLAAVGCAADVGSEPEHNVGVQEQDALGEKLNTTPTAWWWYYGQSAAQVSSLLSANHGRLVSLQVESTSPLLFTVAMVQNSGTYGKTWWWYYGQTGSQLGSLAQSLNARIVNLDPYVVNGTTYFAAVLISNTGTDAKGWWWYYGVSPSQISSLTQQNNARLIDLHQYTVNGATTYAVVMVQNTGTDATAWWWYYNIPAAQLSNVLSQNNAFLISIEPSNSSGSALNVVMNRNPGINAGWYNGSSTDPYGLSFMLNINRERLLDIKSYFVNGTRYFAAAMLPN